MDLTKQEDDYLKLLLEKRRRSLFQKKTTYACILLFIAAGLEAVGVNGSLEIAKIFAEMFGLPLAVYGVADRISKK